MIHNSARAHFCESAEYKMDRQRSSSACVHWPNSTLAGANNFTTYLLHKICCCNINFS